jgi:hypothetical protein
MIVEEVESLFLLGRFQEAFAICLEALESVAKKKLIDDPKNSVSDTPFVADDDTTDRCVLSPANTTQK